MTVDYEVAVRRHRIGLLHSGDTLIGLVELVPEQDCVLIENVAVLPASAVRIRAPVAACTCARLAGERAVEEH